MKNIINFKKAVPAMALTREGLATGVLIGIIAGVVVLGGIIFLTTSNRTEAPTNTGGDAMMDKDEKAAMAGDKMMGEDSMMKDKEAAMMEDKAGTIMKDEKGAMMEYSGTVLAGTSAKLLDFKKTDYDKALASGNLVVLYFYANWCPICKEEFPKMQSAFNELKSDKVIAFRVNYKDNETDKDEEALAREFGVSYQHTKVFLKNGARVLKAPDSWDKSRYLSEITKFLTN